MKIKINLRLAIVEGTLRPSDFTKLTSKQLLPKSLKNLIKNTREILYNPSIIAKTHVINN